jgi:hypothetical protein
MNRFTGAAMAMLVLSAATAWAQEGTARTDRWIRAQVKKKLEKKDIARIAVGVTDGTVSLSGTVQRVGEEDGGRAGAQGHERRGGVRRPTRFLLNSCDSFFSVGPQVLPHSSFAAPAVLVCQSALADME